jgi:hypothetical protein
MAHQYANFDYTFSYVAKAFDAHATESISRRECTSQQPVTDPRYA